MSQALIEKIRRARERVLVVGEHHYTIRRPTDGDALELQGVGPLAVVKDYVVGWDLREIDLVPGGTPEPVAFSAALWAEWVPDHPEVWTPLALAIIDDYKAHVEAREATAKN